MTAAAQDGGIRMLEADELLRRAPLRRDGLVGGALIEADLQTDPRTAATAIVRHLTARGVEFRFRTAVTALGAGRVETTRGAIDAGAVVVAVNHDIDQLLPEVAERHGVMRCALDMLRAAVSFPRPLTAPLLTGWSLIRYGRFADGPEARVLRERLHAERPDLAALDLNQMYTQLPDGTLILGDSHATAAAPRRSSPRPRSPRSSARPRPCSSGVHRGSSSGGRACTRKPTASSSSTAETTVRSCSPPPPASA